MPSNVPRPRSANDTAINFRLPGRWLDEAEALIPSLNEPGLPTYTRMDVLRLALRKGLDELKRTRRGR